MQANSGSSTNEHQLANKLQHPLQNLNICHSFDPFSKLHRFDSLQFKRKIFQKQCQQTPSACTIQAYNIESFQQTGFLSPSDITHLQLQTNLKLPLSRADLLFSQCSNLIKLSISFNSFNYYQMEQIFQLISIKCPYIQEIQIKTRGIKILKNVILFFPQLKRIRIVVETISWDMDIILYELSYLQEIHLTSERGDYDFSPFHFLQIKNLKSLTLNTTMYQDRQFKLFKQITKIKCAISWTITFAGSNYKNIQMLFDTITRIQKLQFMKITLFTQKNMEDVCDNLITKVKKMQFQVCENLESSYCIEMLTYNNRSVEDVTFDLAHKHNFVKVVEGLQNWKLKYIGNWFNKAAFIRPYVEDLGIKILVTSHPQLLSLSFRNSQNITDQTIRIISSFRKLQELSLSGCNLIKISNSSLMYLRRLKNLKKLKFEKYSLFSYSCFCKLLGNLKLVPMMDYYENWFQDDGKAKRMKENGNKGVSIWMKRNVL